MDRAAVASRLLGLCVFVFSLAGWAVPACTGAPGDEHWSTAFSYPGISGSVLALVSYNGDLIAGGSFSLAGGVPVDNVARWDGSAWHPLGTGIHGSVQALTVYGGKLIVVGTFDQAGGGTANNIAQWDGAGWAPVGLGTNGAVAAVTEFKGELVVGGGFSVAGSSAAKSLARWDGSTWHAFTSVETQGVGALAVYHGFLYAGGVFPQAGGPGGLAVWTGASWFVMPDVAGYVYALSVFDGSLFVGGQFNAAIALHSANLGRFDGQWHNVGNAGGMIVNALGTDGTRLFAAGNGPFGGASTALWDGTFFQPIEGSPNGAVWALGGFNGALIAGGGFTRAGDTPTGAIARLNELQWGAFGGGDSGQGLNASCLALCLWRGDLIAAGGFSWAGSTAAGRIARWDGGAWHAMPEASTRFDGGFDAAVRALAVQGNDLLVGGDFRRVGQLAVSGVARYDGARWVGLGAGLNGIIVALAAIGDTVFAAGEVPGGVARWDGTSWSPMGTFGLPGQVYCLTVYHGALIAGGHFSFDDGPGSVNVARWDGRTWRRLKDGLTGPSEPTVFAVTVYQDRLIAAGRFANSGSASVSNLAQWDGANWTTVGEGVDGPGMAVTTRGTDLVVGGIFPHAGAVPANSIARWNGSIWSPLGSGLSNYVFALAPVGDNLFVGGQFTVAGGRSSEFLALWNESLTPIQLLSFTAEREGAAAVLRWRISDPSAVLGLHVYRQEFGRERVRLTSRLVTGHEQFDFSDPAPPNGPVAYWLSAVERGGVVSWYGPRSLPAVDRIPIVRLSVSPNPFFEQVQIGYELREPSAVAVEILDVQGRSVYGWSLPAQDAGAHQLAWDGGTYQGQPAAMGTYFVRLRAGSSESAARLLKLR